MAAPNSAYSEALSAAIANYSATLADNISNNNALLSYIKGKGNVNTFDGGTEILQNISYPGDQPSGWYTGAEVLDVSSSDTLSTANFAIKQTFANVTFSGLDKIIHSGKSQMHDFFKAKIKNAEATLSNLIGESLFYSNTEAGGKAIGGLQHLVSDLGTGTVGGIDSSVDVFWKNKIYDFSTESVTPSATTIIPALNTAYRSVVYGAEQPDLIVAGDTYFGYFEGALQANQRFASADMGKAGFMGYAYKKAQVVFDPNCNDERMYVLNTNYLHFRPNKGRNFVTDKEKMSVNQDAWVVPIYWAGNMTVSGRRYQAVIVA